MMPAARGCGSDDTAQTAHLTVIGRESPPSGCEGDKEGLFAFIELAQLTLLDYQHTQQLTPLDDRHAKEGAKTLLLNSRDVFKAGMLLRIGEVDRFGQPPHQADKTFIKCECDCAPTGFFSPRVAIR